MTRSDLAVSDIRIREFWAWFTSAHEMIEELVQKGKSESLACEVDSHLRNLTRQLGWEIGPGHSKTFSLAFTLNGRKESMAIGQSIVLAAPDMSNWEFHVGKPQKIWNGQLRVRNSRGQSVTLETAKWRYVLTGFSNNSFFDIELIAKEIPDMDAEARMQIAHLVVESYLGEAMTLERIDKIDLKAVHGKANEAESQLRDLRDHIALLVSVR